MLGLLADTLQVYVADEDTTSHRCNCECSRTCRPCCGLSSGDLRCLTCSPAPLITLVVLLQDPLEENDLVTIAELGLRLVSRPLGEIMSHAESLARAKRWALAWVQGSSQGVEGAVGGDADLCEFIHPFPVFLGAVQRSSAGRWLGCSSQALEGLGVCTVWSCTPFVYAGDVFGPSAGGLRGAVKRPGAAANSLLAGKAPSRRSCLGLCRVLLMSSSSHQPSAGRPAGCRAARRCCRALGMSTAWAAPLPRVQSTEAFSGLGQALKWKRHFRWQHPPQGTQQGRTAGQHSASEPILTRLCLPAAAEVLPKLERILSSPYCTTKPQMQTLDPPPVKEEPQVVPSYGSASNGLEGQEAADVEPQESHTFPGAPDGEQIVAGSAGMEP